MRRRVLVVDDDDAVRYLCAAALRDYEVLQACNGKEALQVLSGKTVDVILTDFMMPEMNGLELLHAVKEKEPNRLVVMMTSFGNKEVVLRALKESADDFVEKPIDLVQVRSVVERAIEKKTLRDELMRLRQSDRLKTEFLGLVSHKLKTPITVITLAVQMLTEDAGKAPGPEVLKKTEMIQAQAWYLDALVDSLMSFSELILHEGEAKIESVDLRGLAGACLEDVRKSAALKGVEVDERFEGPSSPLTLDRQRVEFILRALLDNALKFTGQGGKVSLTVAVEQAAIRIAVGDSGVGIAPEEQAKIFEKFYQVDPDHTGQVPGFGLGLFYVRRFVQDLGGRLELESAPGEGTSVTVLIPRSADGA